MEAPAYYQTWWFCVSCALLCLGVTAFAIKVRIRHASDRLRAQLEERLLERERIARELHDTLLQGLQGLILCFQAVAARIPPDAPAREQMERALQRADEILIESRDRVKDLRGSLSGPNDLAGELAATCRQLALEFPTTFHLGVQGERRAVHPMVGEEVLLIAREALANAFRHARAANIETTVAYGQRELRIAIRDDGCGIAGDVLKAGGRPGHWGILSMRERARRIRGRLEIDSRPEGGTRVELHVRA